MARLLVVLAVVLALTIPALAQSALCAQCLKVVGWLEGELSNQNTEAAVIKALDTACGYLPAKDQAQCDNLVAKYLPSVVTWILTNEAPQIACGQVGLCQNTSDDVAAPAPSPPTPAPTTPPPSNSTACKVCEILVAGVELYIQQHPNDSAKMVVAYLDKICNISFLAKYKAECTILVMTEGTEIVDAIFAGKPAETVCSSTFPPICPKSARAEAAHAHKAHEIHASQQRAAAPSFRGRPRGH